MLFACLLLLNFIIWEQQQQQQQHWETECVPIYICCSLGHHTCVAAHSIIMMECWSSLLHHIHTHTCVCVCMCATKKHQIKKNTHIHIYTKEYNYYINNNTTPNNGYLGSREDEVRSEMRYVVWIAGISESSNLWTHVALSWSPPESTFAWVPLLFIIEMRIYLLAARQSRGQVDDTGFVCRLCGVPHSLR